MLRDFNGDDSLSRRMIEDGASVRGEQEREEEPPSSNYSAYCLVVASCLFASLVSLIASDLTEHRGYQWSVVLFYNGASGTAATMLWWLILGARASGADEMTPAQILLGAKSTSTKWLLLQGVATAVQVAAAFLTLSLLSLADANVIMFTAPVFTGLLAWGVYGEALKSVDVFVTLACLGGVALVEAPWAPTSDDDDDGGGRESITGIDGDIVGVASALAFALFLSVQLLIVNQYLREEHLCAVNFYTFFTILCTSWPAVIWAGGKGLGDWHTVAPYELIGLGPLFLLFIYLRSVAFQISRGALGVANLLYVSLPHPLALTTLAITTMMVVVARRPRLSSPLSGSSLSSRKRSAYGATSARR